MSELVPLYVKVNRKELMTTRCLRFWASVMAGADVYLVCDWDEATIAKWVPPEFGYREVVPTSERAREAVRGKVPPNWRNAGAAQMTTADHATENGVEHYWSIDGDDTMFLHEAEDVLAKMMKVQAVMSEEGISAASLDFYQTYYDYWSFGVACFRGDVDYFDLLAAIDPRAVARHFPDDDARWSRGWGTRDENGNFRRERVAANMTLDWVFTYMRDQGTLRAATFYFDDMYFFHAGMALRLPEFDVSGYTMRGLYHWKDGALWDDPVRENAIRI
jgi:hypothetical protein